MKKKFRGLIKDKLDVLIDHHTRLYTTWAAAQKAAERLLKKYGSRYEIVIQEDPDDFS